jgi:hypothetical protein
MTDCTAERFEFQGVRGRPIVARFDGGRIVSDGGATLLHAVEQRVGILRRFAECFVDHRDSRRVEHRIHELVVQRVFALALGYEDLNDHDELRRDPLLAAMAGKRDPEGENRRLARDRGAALAGKSTLQRLESSVAGSGAGDRYRRFSLDGDAVDRLFVKVFMESFERPPRRIVLDLDATDNPLHGHQEGRFFHGYYDCYCYLPLYIFCGDHLLCARLRRSNIDASAGTVEELERIVEQIRTRWPKVEIWVRGDSGFAREELMRWCEDHKVDYVFGLARNTRLEAALEPAFERAEALCGDSGRQVRLFDEFPYRTLDTWSRSRRVVGKAEILDKGPNPRFIVTSIAANRLGARFLYEKIYCARGEMENRIKEQQLYLFSTRTSAQLMRVNQVRLWLSGLAYLLLDALRRIGLSDSSMARARCDTLRLKLLKIGAHVKISARRVVLSLASSHPGRDLFAHAYGRLRAGPASS